MKFTTAATVIAVAAIVPAVVHARINANSSRNLAPGSNGGGGGNPGNDNDTICTALYDPVCGVDGITYSNDCTAAAAGVEVAYDGECNNGSTTTTSLSVGDPCVKEATDPCGSGLVCMYSTAYPNEASVCLCNAATNEGCSDTQVCFELRGTGPICYDCDCNGGKVCGITCGSQDVPPSCVSRGNACYTFTPGLFI